jgi:hypothetical protein
MITIKEYCIAAIRDYIIEGKEYPKGGLGHNFNSTTDKQGINEHLKSGILSGLEVLIRTHGFTSNYQKKNLHEWIQETPLRAPAYCGFGSEYMPVWNLYYWLKILEEQAKPVRFRVIKAFPDNDDFPVGRVFEIPAGERFLKIRDGVNCYIAFFEKYPHLFERVK